MILHAAQFVLSLFLLLLTPTRSTPQGFIHIKFVITCCLQSCRFEIFSRWHPVDQFSIFPSMQQNNILKETSLCLCMTFQQRWFLKYSRSYWANLVLQNCQGSVFRLWALWNISVGHHKMSHREFFLKWLVYVKKKSNKSIFNDILLSAIDFTGGWFRIC